MTFDLLVVCALGAIYDKSLIDNPAVVSWPDVVSTINSVKVKMGMGWLENRHKIPLAQSLMAAGYMKQSDDWHLSDVLAGLEKFQQISDLNPNRLKIDEAHGDE